MKDYNFKVLINYTLVILGFVIVSLSYFYPILSGKKIYQSDIVQYTGMAKTQIDYRGQTGEELYWTDNAFGGMPTYQNGALYPHNYVKQLDWLIRFLPRPADYLFLYLLGFFVLLKCFKISTLESFIGSLVFGFSTYLIIIIGVGHNAKAHAIGYMPMVIAGVILCLNQKLIKGGILFTIAMALELVANHYQMTYYLMILLMIVTLVYGILAFQNKNLISFFKSCLVLLTGLLIAIGLNATSILATKEYSEFSTRGSNNLSVDNSGNLSSSSGLNTDYILSYSYGIAETFNLLIPRFMGGSSSEDAGNDASIVKELVGMGYSYPEAREFAKNAPTYWGEQPYVGAPAYIGAGIIFLFVLGLISIKDRNKYWIVGGVILSILLSWGANLEWFSKLFINYFPLYNKFRAVTSIQVITELCVPFLGVWALHSYLNTDSNSIDIKLKQLYKATGIVGGTLLLFVVLKTVLFSFSNSSDAELIQNAGARFVRALREDRMRLFTNDTLRSLFFVIAIASLLWVFTKQKISKISALIAIGVLLISDLVLVDWRYVNSDDFVNSKLMTNPYSPNKADLEILKDTSHHRVYDLTGSPFNSSRTSYFHKAIGGYHAAKPERIQNLNDYYITSGYQPILNMLNVKYFIYEGEKGVDFQENKSAFGNAWFVSDLITVPSEKEELTKLKSIQLKSQAIVNNDSGLTHHNFSLDSLATIRLTNYSTENLEYSYTNKNDGFVVFSEMYYQNGWKAFIDDIETPIYKTNYALRGIKTPKGKHKVVFKFIPQVVKTGSLITIISLVIFLVLIALCGYAIYSKKISN